MSPESVRVPLALLMNCPAVALPKVIGAEIVLLPALLLIAAEVPLVVARRVRAIVESAEDNEKLPVAKVMAPVVVFAVRFGFTVPVVPLNVARSAAAAPGVTPPFQLDPVLHKVLLFDVHVAF
jgi:hypothetical protein